MLNEERGIDAELAKAPVRPEGMEEAVDALCEELIVNARRASDVDLYLKSVDVRRPPAPAGGVRRGSGASRRGRPTRPPRSRSSSQVVEALAGKRRRLDEEIANLQASLGTIRARLVQARAEASTPTVGAADVTELRDRMRALADGLAEAYGHNSDSPTTMKGT